MRPLQRLLVLAACAGSLGAGTSCGVEARFLASPSDYADYREVRLTHGFLARLGKAWQYLGNQPEGAFRPEVERWFQRADERFLERHWDDLGNLERYLALLPTAPRAGLVQERIAVLHALRDGVQREADAFTAEERQRQADFDAARQSRGLFVRTVMGWVELLSASGDFGKQVDDWSSALRQPLFEQPPVALCDEANCRKPLLLGFEIPRHAGLETRGVAFTITLTLDGGQLTAAHVAGAGLFDRLAEAATARPVDPGDLQGRAEAIGISAQLLGLAAAAGFAEQECEREAVSPVILARECGGKALFVIAAEEPTEEDRIVVQPSGG